MTMEDTEPEKLQLLVTTLGYLADDCQLVADARVR